VIGPGMIAPPGPAGWTRIGPRHGPWSYDGRAGVGYLPCFVLRPGPPPRRRLPRTGGWGPPGAALVIETRCARNTSHLYGPFADVAERDCSSGCSTTGSGGRCQGGPGDHWSAAQTPGRCSPNGDSFLMEKTSWTRAGMASGPESSPARDRQQSLRQGGSPSDPGGPGHRSGAATSSLRPEPAGPHRAKAPIGRSGLGIGQSSAYRPGGSPGRPVRPPAAKQLGDNATGRGG